MNAPSLYVERLIITQNASVTFATVADPGVDPVMYLLRVEANELVTQVAQNDDVNWPSDPNSSVSYVNSGPTADFLLIIRAYDDGSAGLADLNLDGALYRSNIPVGGKLQPFTAFTFSAGDVLHTTQIPGESVAPAVIALSGGNTITRIALGNGVGGAATLPTASDDVFYLFGTPYLVTNAGTTDYRAGSANALFNDTQSDADGDGVGDLLEAALQTCSTVQGCPNAFHGYDTDRDGIQDGQEIFGVAGTLPDGSDDLPLSRWGANPRHKDVFMEVDYLTNLGAPVATSQNPFDYLRDNPNALALAGWGGTLEGWVAKVREPYLVGPNAEIRNPDGLDGVEVHLDLGAAPLNLSDEAKFGSWSTGSLRRIVEDWILDFSGTVTGTVTVQINSQTRSFYADNMPADELGASVGLIVLGIAADFGEDVTVKSFSSVSGGSPTSHLSVATLVLGKHFTRSITLPPAYASNVSITHEGAGSLRARADQPTQFDVNRRKIMRWAVITGTGGGGQTNGVRFVSGMTPIFAFAHELGHTLGLQHYGHAAWNTAPFLCLPQYNSLMGYTGVFTSFSTDATAASLDFANSQETAPFGSGFQYSVFNVKPYTFPVTVTFPPAPPTGVDWNLDGYQGPVGSGWRSFAATPVQYHSCSGFTAGSRKISTGSDVLEGAPELIRFRTQLYAFWTTKATATTSAQLMYRHAPLGGVGNKSCTGSSDSRDTNSPCLDWSPTQVLVNPSQKEGVSALVYQDELWLATTWGIAVVRRYGADANGNLSFLSASMSPYGGDDYLTDTPPELVIRHQSVHNRPLGMIYLARSGQFASFGWDGSQWVYEGPLRMDGNPDPVANIIHGTQAPAATAWPDETISTVTPNVTWSASEKRTLAVLPGTDGLVQVYALNPATNKWIHLYKLDISWRKTTGRPSITYRSVRNAAGAVTSDYKGHFMISYLDNGNSRPVVFFSTLVSKFSPPSIGAAANLDDVENGDIYALADFLYNIWTHVQPNTNTALYSDASLDNVFAVSTSSPPVPVGELGLIFYPHADGSPSGIRTTQSDFRVMEDMICDGLFRFGPSTIECGVINVMD